LNDLKPNNMELPKYHETFMPILEILNTLESIKSRELASQVRDKYYSYLPQELMIQKTSSGANVLLDRILWGKSYLKMGKFVSYPKRGFVQINEKGKRILSIGKLALYDLHNDSDFLIHRESVKNELKNELELDVVNVENASPQDLIDTGFSTIEKEVKAELLEKLKEIDPYYFEKVILILLKKMGYGDFIETSKSGDGGIDGIINEDKLGLEKIYTQAKRYNENKVREKDIRNFIGAMSGDTSKGVFITTSTFDDSAIKKAKEAHHRIILIDGLKLVDLMHQYNVGVQVKTVYEVKELDNDFFEED
jgi:restriction system protein